MNIKEMIKLLIDVEVDTEDLRLLKEHPKEHVATKRVLANTVLLACLLLFLKDTLIKKRGSEK